ncbi:uncharacterized protein LOC135297771 [Passer domesticus]|uniref:uncharacterized protein LOC135297771 n=1 Tax=Passer domesticus TaxID=48849 RepID=UPI0030FEA09B
MRLSATSLDGVEDGRRGEGQSTEEPRSREPGQGPPQVLCSSWCCESGRHQSENGYFTTPGSHRTTLRPRLDKSSFPVGRQGTWSTSWLLPREPRPAKVIRCSTPI